ncbi:MAG TPA: PDZ domain-containing protein [Mycobacteriales bacterium]|nr:PDZ domain-containing protein [Mycobacteriales bacterium]HVW80688.1 PDZ domain-containing protein [Mycobacteriales bacterium]
MTRRGLTFGIAAVLFLAMLVIAARLPVPYVVLVPGPVTDTLGQTTAHDSITGKPGDVIQISGAKVQPTDGHLYMTTVGLIPGDCSDHPTLWDAIKAWFSSSEAVEPHQVQCPPGQSSATVNQQGVDEMTEAQGNAVYAALTELGYHPTGNAVFVGSVVAGGPAASVLEPNDEIVSVDGTAITGTQQLVSLVQRVEPGHTVTLVVKRAGEDKTVQVRPIRDSTGKTRIGIAVESRPTFNGINVSIGIDPDVIEGPSAGTALALGIIDKLTPGGITGGRTIAGTGTVSRLGKVGPIGGIQQKIAAAVSAGATVFFAPASECADAKAVAPASLKLVAITTLHQAVAALEAIKNGSDDYPHC